MITLAEKRIQREYEDIDGWRFAEVHHVTKYRYYACSGKKRRRKTGQETVYENPLFTATLINDEIRNWKVMLNYPDFSGQKIELVINFPASYPFEPPVVKFVSNASLFTIRDCLDSKNNLDFAKIMYWSPAYTAGACLLVVTSILFPNWTETNGRLRQTQRSNLLKMELYEKTTTFKNAYCGQEQSHLVHSYT